MKRKNILVELLLLLQSLEYTFSKPNMINAGDPSIYIFPPKDSELTNKVKLVEKILIDAENERVYAASLNKLFCLSLDLKTVVKVVDMPNSCKETDPGCKQNYIKELKFDLNKRIYVCGTVGVVGKCWRFTRDLVQIPSMTVSGINRVSKDHNVNTVSLFIDPYIFTATYSDQQYMIRKMNLYNAKEDDIIATTRKDVQVLQEPSFVSSYRFDDSGYVYFFFREKATEQPNRPMIFSRVARICRDDNGHKFVLGKKFVTFLKSHLVCKKSGSNGDYYYYDEIQSTYMVDVHDTGSSKPEKFIYGVFSLSSAEGVGNSAICRYRVKDIIKVLETSPYAKIQDNNISPENFTATRTATSRPQCDGSKLLPEFRAVTEATENVLLFQSVEPYDKNPVFTTSAGLTSIVVDDFHLRNNKSDVEMHMLFAGTVNGNVYKIMINSSGRSAGSVVEIIEPFKSTERIYTLVKHNDFVYAGGANGIASFSVQRCNSYLLCSDCVKFKDPYCAWDRSAGKCATAKSLSVTDRIQDIHNGDDSQCPKTTNNFYCNVSIEDALPGFYAMLKCSTPDGKPKIIAWLRNNKMIYSDNSYKIWKQGDSMDLMIKPFNAKSAGKYECTVELGGERKKCEVYLEAPPTTQNYTTKRPLITANVTDRANATTTPKGVPYITKQTTYKIHFIVVLLVAIILLVICICLLIKSRQRPNDDTQTDGMTSNGHTNAFHFPFTKNYKMNRKDSANKELLKQKNKNPENRVYKPTTIEMSVKNNGVAEPV